MRETSPPRPHSSSTEASLDAFAATIEGVRKMPAPTTMPTMSAMASATRRLGRGSAADPSGGAAVSRRASPGRPSPWSRSRLISSTPWMCEGMDTSRERGNVPRSTECSARVQRGEPALPG